MFKFLVLTAFIGLTALVPTASAEISYTLTVSDSGGSGPILLAKAMLPDFITQDILVWPPQLRYCADLYMHCDSVQFIVDSHEAGLSGSPYAAVGLVEHYAEEIGGIMWLYYPRGAFSILGSHPSLFGNTQLTVAVVPEPAVAGLIALGIPALLLRRRKHGQVP